jgi:hypothetical protein
MYSVVDVLPLGYLPKPVVLARFKEPPSVARAHVPRYSYPTTITVRDACRKSFLNDDVA